MWVGVLGPLEVRDGDRLIPIRGTIRTSLLAALICPSPPSRSGTPADRDLWLNDHTAPKRRCRATWTTSPAGIWARPGAASSRPAPATALTPSEPGIDAHQFADAVERVRRQLAQGQPATGTGPLGSVGPGVPMRPTPSTSWTSALRSLARVIRTPISPDAPFLVAERVRLSRNCGCARWNGGPMRADGPRASRRVLHPSTRATELQSIPFREKFSEQLILALYRSGRQVDALAAYRRVPDSARTDELGVEPDPATPGSSRPKVLGPGPSPCSRSRPTLTARARRGPARIAGLEGYQADGCGPCSSAGSGWCRPWWTGWPSPASSWSPGRVGPGSRHCLRAGVVPSIRMGADAGQPRLAGRRRADAGPAGRVDGADLLDRRPGRRSCSPTLVDSGCRRHRRAVAGIC